MVKEADLQYLRNINTKPGPDAGRSIDPTKPGPDDATVTDESNYDPWLVEYPDAMQMYEERVKELEAECGRFENELFEARAELKQVEAENEHHIRLAFIDAGANPARTWKEEAERLAKLIGWIELFLDPKVIEEIGRLRKENEELKICKDVTS